MILVDNYEAMTARPEIGCNLECVKEDLATDLVHEYCGPVKIVVVETPKQEYLFKSWGAGFLAFANMLVGAICFVVLMREAALGKDNPDTTSSMHIVLCTLGLIFLSSFGMMNMMPVYGASSPLKKKHRQSEHLLFHSVGLLFSACGAVFYMGGADELDFSSLHTGSCALGLAFGLGAEVMGFLFARIMKKPLAVATLMHILVGFIAYTCYITCFLSCIDYDYFRKFLLRMAKSSGRPTMIVTAIHLYVIIAFACLVTCLLLFKRKRKPTCRTFEDEKKREKGIKKKAEKAASKAKAKAKAKADADDD